MTIPLHKDRPTWVHLFSTFSPAAPVGTHLPRVELGETPFTAQQVADLCRHTPRRLVNVTFHASRNGLLEGASMLFTRETPGGSSPEIRIDLSSFVSPAMFQTAHLQVPINSETLDGYTRITLVFPPAGDDGATVDVAFTFGPRGPAGYEIIRTRRPERDPALEAEAATIERLLDAFGHLDDLLDPEARVRVLRAVGAHSHTKAQIPHIADALAVVEIVHPIPSDDDEEPEDWLCPSCNGEDGGHMIDCPERDEDEDDADDSDEGEVAA